MLHQVQGVNTSIMGADFLLVQCYISGEPSNNSFISANDQTVVNDIANMSDVDTDAEPDNT